ncbi:UNVERIFIED_CONTAM: hypothetical protein GTU68_024487 [Idotea baltica]|nr:hypothetical protein [Idotea baltica]
MKKENIFKIWKQIGLRYKSHPWHGIEIGEEAPELVTAFIEVVPSDTVKYEIDKVSGYLKVDRPQKFSNIVPALYGFVPQTYCMDGDPLDICVLTERAITHGNVLVPAIPIGGLRMIDNGEADDKIIAVLKGDEVYQKWKDISDVPPSIIKRLNHYFLTYKEIPGNENSQVVIDEVYGREEALNVIKYSMQDYRKKFGKLENKLSKSVLEAFTYGQSWAEILREE